MWVGGVQGGRWEGREVLVGIAWFVSSSQTCKRREGKAEVLVERVRREGGRP